MLNNLFSQAGSITYKNVRTRDIAIQWNPPANVPGAVWNGFLRINTAVPAVGLAGLQLHGTVAGGGIGAQVNWAAGVNVPLVVNDQGPAPGPPIAPFPVVQNWIHLGGHVLNIVVHTNDYQITALAGFHMTNAGAPVQNLLIINQLQSALFFS